VLGLSLEFIAGLTQFLLCSHFGVQVQAGSYLTSPIGPSAVAFEQPFKSPRTEYKRQRKDVRQRGSIKFTDNPHMDEM